jgi:type IV secretory pathway VirJ component
MARAMRMCCWLLAWLPVLAGCARGPAPTTRRLDAGRLGSVRVIGLPHASAGLVFLFSSERGWDASAERAADLLARRNVVVVGVDLPAYLAGLAASDDGCHYLISEIEELSKRIQHDAGFADYRTPVLAGFGAGGTLAYAALAQSPAATVAGAAAVDPAPALATKVPLCEGAAAKPASGGGFSYAPDAELPGWYAPAAAGGDQAARLVAALDQHLKEPASGADARVAALPLIEYPVDTPSALMAVIYSGDGGWRDLDKQIGEALSDAGVPVVGIDSLRYFWSRKSPETLGADLAAIIRDYSTRWQASKVVLIGYSFGADVLPFAVNNLPEGVRARVAQISLLGLEATAAFEFTIAEWFGSEEAESPVLPQLLKIDPHRIQCFYGEDEDDSLCPDPALRDTEVIRTGGGHHFDGDYDAIATQILDGARQRAGLTSPPSP